MIFCGDLPKIQYYGSWPAVAQLLLYMSVSLSCKKCKGGVTMTQLKEERKLEFYGGTWIALLPFVIFLVLILLTTFIWGSISDGALWVPAFAAIMLPFFLA